MVVIKFVGGIKKSFLSDHIEIEIQTETLEKIIELVLEQQPKNTPTIDLNNILIAVNGTESSSLQGKSTLIKNNDQISIIPIIHGGSGKKINLKLEGKSVLITEINGKKISDDLFLDELRNEFPRTTLQAVSSSFVLNSYHLKKIISISLKSVKENILLSNKLETDLLMRFAATTQISEAIKLVGIKPKKNFILIAIGTKPQLEKLYKRLKPLTVGIFSKDNSSFLKKQYKISKKQLNSVYSKTPLEDLLIEKAAVLL